MAADDSATVRGEDGAEAFYRLENGAYVRPPGVRSTLRRAGDGWELVTPSQIGSSHLTGLVLSFDCVA